MTTINSLIDTSKEVRRLEKFIQVLEGTGRDEKV